MSNQHSLQYGSTTIAYELSYTDREKLAVHVHPDTSISVEAPLDSDFARIEEKVRKRAAWIVKQQSKFRRYSFEIPHRQYVSGESHRYLGRQYRLRVIADDTPMEVVRMDRGIITMFVRRKSPNHVKKVLDGWMRERARTIFAERIAEWHPRFERYDILYPQVIVRRMKSRWGSCTEAGKITLNLKLIQVSKQLIDYIIVHELCHLVEHSHAPEFYALMSRIMPDWEERKEKLNGFEF
jgi:predicted metal-dependent hydrolase